MKAKIILYVVILAAVFQQSCAPCYVPNVVNSPMLTTDKQLNASVHGGTSGFDMQTAYSPAEHWGVMLNGSYMNQTADSSDDYHKHIFAEAGVGYFVNLGKFGLLDAYAGAGMGRINSLQTSGIFGSEAHVMSARVFIQPSVSFVTDYFQSSLSLRTVMVHIWQGAVSDNGYFFEPTLTIKVGVPAIKLVAQAGLSLPANSHHVSFNYEPFIVSVGLQTQFNTGYKKR
ncbi:MAG: hypothetical protein KBB11_11550 [Bacteroidales bacterium]|nr:hypothetical protein [Bacteroidales bacterium]HQP04776.1 hypothetical protein [Bacteroidales bacterium]